jgi:hypothetical protein
LKDFLSREKIEIKTRKKEEEVLITIVTGEIQNLSVNGGISFTLPSGLKYRPSDVVKAIFPQNETFDFRIIRKNIGLI